MGTEIDEYWQTEEMDYTMMSQELTSSSYNVDDDTMMCLDPAPQHEGSFDNFGTVVQDSCDVPMPDAGPPDLTDPFQQNEFVLTSPASQDVHMTNYPNFTNDPPGPPAPGVVQAFEHESQMAHQQAQGQTHVLQPSGSAGASLSNQSKGRPGMLRRWKLKLPASETQVAESSKL